MFPEVRVVEASAGSGKTTALAKRYIQILLLASRDPLAMKHILAITFTNKAAGQMKERIVELLKRIALGGLAPGEYEDLVAPLGLAKPQAERMAYRLMEELIRQYHFFQVQTIDSFMNALLSGCAFKVGLSARFKIRRDSCDYLELALDEIIAASGRDTALRRLLTDMVRQYLFLENRTGWFPKKDFFAVLKVLFTHQNIYQKGFIKYGDGAQDLWTMKQKFIALVTQMHRLAPEGTHKRFRGWLEDFCGRHTVGFNVDDVNALLAKDNFPVTKGKGVGLELSRLWGEARSNLQAIVRLEAYGIFDPYIDLFDRVMAGLKTHQVKDDVLFLEQLNSKARALFDDGLVTVEELYYRLAARFRHYLIDEFQDTNFGQWANLSMMVEDALSTGGTLFYVGDKKQAIYGFRGGKSELFDRLQDELSHFNVVLETLTKNHRSHRHIVDFNNRIFAVDNLKRFLRSNTVFGPLDEQFCEEMYGHARQEARPELDQGLVRVEMVAGTTKAQREEVVRARLLETLKDVRGRFRWQDMAVLTRSNAQATQVSQWLLSENIPVQSQRTSDVKNHPLVKEFLDYLKFLNSPVDNIGFAAFLSGEIFPPASGMAPQAVRDFLFKERTRPLHKVFQDSFPEMWQRHFARHFQEAGLYPLYELAVSVCHDWRMLEHFPEARGFILHFLELIKRKEEDSCDLQSFLEYFDALEGEERFLSVNDADAVRVLTVHKAKGLEFAVVIIPFLDMAVIPGSGDKDGGQSFVWDESGDGIRLLRLKNSYGVFCEDLRERFHAEYKKEFFAQLNSVYVALTRAKWEMYIFVPERAGNAVNPVWGLVPDDARAVGQVSRPGPLKPEVPPRSLLETSVSRRWISRLHEDFAGQDLDDANTRLKGEAAHFCLACLGDLNGADVRSSVENAVGRMADRFPSQDTGAYKDWFSKFLQRKDVRPLFFPPPATQVICEQEIVNRFGDTRRVDRLLVMPGEVWVVDFKTSRKDEASHQKQMDEYVDLVRALYPGRTVHGKIVYV
ncbi:MAG: UvrD-helicase domain-containing protein [Candidatus Omnitrophica bacterium]|nr:UvrD-helicase domain-containing protein [Candidatus Omnitrophota bacterium]